VETLSTFFLFSFFFFLKKKSVEILQSTHMIAPGRMLFCRGVGMAWGDSRGPRKAVAAMWEDVKQKKWARTLLLARVKRSWIKKKKCWTSRICSNLWVCRKGLSVQYVLRPGTSRRCGWV